MRKWIVSAAAIILILCLAACQGKTPAGTKESVQKTEDAADKTVAETNGTEDDKTAGDAEMNITEDDQAAEDAEPEKKEKPKYNIKEFKIPDTEAFQFIKDMKIGWNLGNAFDAKDCTWLSDELDYESGWCGAKTTPELIDAIKAAGFNTIRIPVSWHNHVDSKYTISEPWLNRVQEVVDYCIDRDLYVIINIHHDNDEAFLYPTSKYLDQSVKYVTTIWKQVAGRFKDYDDKLIFAGMNEPRMVGHNNEWWIDPKNEDCKDAIACVNTINQAFVDTVRKTGGNNASRYLICPGYDASPDGALNDGFVFPTDPVAENDHRIILSVHAYTPYSFALESPGTDSWSSANSKDLNDMIWFMDRIYTTFVSNGTPVIIDEFGAQEKNGNLEARIDFAGCYIAQSRARGITCIWWDNNCTEGDGERFGLIDRATRKWIFPEIAEAMMEYAE